VKTRTKKYAMYLGLLVVVCAALHANADDVKALPMFARRYNVPCSTCHTSAPRLNETGYKFRAAGFRMPEEIGQEPERPYKLFDHVGFRLQPRYDAIRTSLDGHADTTQKVNLFAAEAYIWYGPISKYVSSNLKVTIFPEESNETEDHERVEGNIRFNYGNADKFLDIRAGVPHPMEGFGGSEYYVASNTRPFIQELRTAFFNQETFFAPIGFHQAGITLAYHYKRTSVRALVLSGFRLKTTDEGELMGFGRREPFTKAMPHHNEGGPDVQLFFNQILHPNGGNVSVYFYDGRSSLPRLDLLPPGTVPIEASRRLDLAAFPESVLQSHPVPRATSDLISATQLSQEEAALETVPWFENHFNRLAFYAGYPIGPARFLFGIQRGRDAIGSGGRFTSLGHFTEAMIKVINDISAVGVRYDWFDPARGIAENDTKGLTAYLNVWLHNELRVTPEYQHLMFNRGVGVPSRTEDRFQLRLYWVK